MLLELLTRLAVHGNTQHLGTRSADEQHPSDSERDRPTLDYRRNLDRAQTIRPPSHCV